MTCFAGSHDCDTRYGAVTVLGERFLNLVIESALQLQHPKACTKGAISADMHIKTCLIRTPSAELESGFGDKERGVYVT